MELPASLLRALEATRSVGRPRLVGGCVRDWLLGLPPKDFDVEVPGASFDDLERALAPLGATDVVGKSFGVIKLRTADAEYDFSLPRRESKTGQGHRGFRVEPDPTLSDAEAAMRRDFTINAIAYDPTTGELIDPLRGKRDLRDRVLRHTGPAFVEDPLRVLRGMQLAARFILTPTPATVAVCRAISATFQELPKERVWAEWDKWATQSRQPSRGLDLLRDTGWLRHFPLLAAMEGCPQDPRWHPEGDVFHHTAHCLDALVSLPLWREAPLARRRMLSLAVLTHDIAKPETTSRRRHSSGRMRWTSPGHEPAGAPLARRFLEELGAPHELYDPVAALVANHLAHHSADGEYTDSQVRRLARRLQPATIDDLAAVMEADARGRPPVDPTSSLACVEALQGKAAALAIADAGPSPILLGRHLVEMGLRPSPHFGTVLDAAFEAQLDGAFADLPGALAWAEKQLPHFPGNLAFGSSPRL